MRNMRAYAIWRTTHQPGASDIVHMCIYVDERQRERIHSFASHYSKIIESFSVFWTTQLLSDCPVSWIFNLQHLCRIYANKECFTNFHGHCSGPIPMLCLANARTKMKHAGPDRISSQDFVFFAFARNVVLCVFVAQFV